MDIASVEHATPILVGCGDVTDTATAVSAGRSPFELMAEAGRRAMADTKASAITQAIDTLAVPRLFSDSTARYASRLGSSSNPPKSVADRLGISARRYIYTQVGGNMPQYLVNQFAESISRSEMRMAMIVGGEALRTQLGIERAGLDISWAEDPGGAPELIGNNRAGWSEHEARHRLNGAIAFYPLFENAIRGARSHCVARHLQSMAALWSGFADVASRNPLATRRDGFSAQRLAQVDESNRWIGFPYPRLMNANVFVDQAAAVIVTSVGTAKDLGIPSSRWVFLHGCADCDDRWYVSERNDLHSSPAIRLGSSRALEMAGVAVEDLSFFDLYSCFPSAVEVACQELGLSEDDPRDFTVTGGLPFFGGPGNNYVTHSISEMMRRVRAAPGEYGMVTANGYYLTKHAFGVYSTAPVKGRWQRQDPAPLQSALDAGPKIPFTETPEGSAIIESYTVMHGRRGPEHGIVVGREAHTGRRFIANTHSDAATLHDLQDQESLGRAGFVRHFEGRNTFELD